MHPELNAKSKAIANVPISVLYAIACDFHNQRPLKMDIHWGFGLDPSTPSKSRTPDRALPVCRLAPALLARLAVVAAVAAAGVEPSR